MDNRTLPEHGIDVKDFATLACSAVSKRPVTVKKPYEAPFGTVKWTQVSEENVFEDSPPSPATKPVPSPAELPPDPSVDDATPLEYLKPSTYNPDQPLMKQSSTSQTSGDTTRDEPPAAHSSSMTPTSGYAPLSSASRPEDMVKFGEATSRDRPFYYDCLPHGRSPSFHSSTQSTSDGTERDADDEKSVVLLRDSPLVVKAGKKRSHDDACSMHLGLQGTQNPFLPRGELDSFALEVTPPRKSMLDSLLPAGGRPRHRSVAESPRIQRIPAVRASGTTSHEPSRYISHGNSRSTTAQRRTDGAPSPEANSAKARRGSSDSDFFRQARLNKERHEAAEVAKQMDRSASVPDQPESIESSTPANARARQQVTRPKRPSIVTTPVR
ncbi:hypothetical protein BDZ85DRAFT_21706 [Elsinoe ampelina]|uniref:Uncharacterized protein n=1 Tax=Elsinoe ampelina TaxID=302913 RepID=A0A6A6G574_9PEZI|nr:hypothetical protein BDZ85DRAFT_21706 [Elsinoe ampelina]